MEKIVRKNQITQLLASGKEISDDDLKELLSITPRGENHS